MTQASDQLTVGLAQIAPVWLDRAATVAKVIQQVEAAADRGCQLIAFGEALVPGYPFWIERTDGARFNSTLQKDFHAAYLEQAVQIEAGHLTGVCEAAKKRGVVVVLGIIERPEDRGGHSVYASRVFIAADGGIASVHRKLVPTHEERLVWSPGDGHGLVVHALGAFSVGALNCWENWMPLARAALYGQGEDLHVALWPGGMHNTRDITRFIALESRSYVLSVSGLMREQDFPAGTLHLDRIIAGGDGRFANGGSCIAAPDGTWLVEPVVDREELIVATLDHRRVREERHLMDPAGHYSRPDVTHLVLDRRRQSTVVLRESLAGQQD